MKDLVLILKYTHRPWTNVEEQIRRKIKNLFEGLRTNNGISYMKEIQQTLSKGQKIFRFFILCEHVSQINLKNFNF